MGDDDVNHQRRSHEDRPWHLHAADLYVRGKFLLTEAHRIDRNIGGLERQERLGQDLAGIVGTVRNDHQARDRNAGQFLLSPHHNVAEVRRRARVG